MVQEKVNGPLSKGWHYNNKLCGYSDFSYDREKQKYDKFC